MKKILIISSILLFSLVGCSNTQNNPIEKEKIEQKDSYSKCLEQYKIKANKNGGNGGIASPEQECKGKK